MKIISRSSTLPCRIVPDLFEIQSFLEMLHPDLNLKEFVLRDFFEKVS
jgi:hypothetical protein